MSVTFCATDNIRLGWDGQVWTAVFADQERPLGDRSSFMFVFAILEQDPRAWRRHFRDEADSGRIVEPFPIGELVLHALECSSAYWKALALRSVEEFVSADTQARIERLSSIVDRESTRPSELVRRAKRILRTL